MNACPLDAGWRLWTMFHNRYDNVSPEDAARIAASRNAWTDGIVETLSPRWEIAEDDASRMPMTVGESRDVAWRFKKGSPWHVHTEFPVETDVVHIDICGATRYGPGSFWEETRIHVNGELRGRAGACGCSLGGGGRNGSAIALLTRHIVCVDGSFSIREAGKRNGLRVLVRRPGR
jgi:hypothetical protein